MSVIRVTKEFSFEMAHSLHNYDGPCRNIHGHSYKLKVTVIGEVDNKEDSSKRGMVIDFGDLKSIVENNVIDILDHALMLYDGTDSKVTDTIKEVFPKVKLVNYTPTCENLLIDIANILDNKFPKGITLHHLFLRETDNSYAEYFKEDN